MGFFTYDVFARSALLVCDECDRVLTADGKLSVKRRDESDPDELAPHFGDRDELAKRAVEAGWRAPITPADTHAQWVCHECQRAE